MSYADIVFAMLPAAPPTLKNPPRDLLPGADFGDGAINALIHIDGQRFLVSRVFF